MADILITHGVVITVDPQVFRGFLTPTQLEIDEDIPNMELRPMIRDVEQDRGDVGGDGVEMEVFLKMADKREDKSEKLNN